MTPHYSVRGVVPLPRDSWTASAILTANRIVDMTKQLGKYQIIDRLGEGGFATVFRALDLSLEREVALKVLNPLLMRDPGWPARFRQEARTVARLTHPHIVTIYEIDEIDSRLFIAMQLIDGPNLAEYIKQYGPRPWREVVGIMGQIAAGLDYAHQQQVLHRDLKPSNILLDAQQRITITDFGFARLMGQSSHSMSLSGGLVGSPHYMAPEVWEEQESSPATDIYALGCILYELVTGKQLFQGDSIPGIMRAHFRPLALPTDWPDGVPACIAPILYRALAQDPDMRYTTAGAMMADLTARLRPEPAAIHEPQATATRSQTEGNGPFPKRETRKLDWSIWMAGGFGLLVIGCLLYLFMGNWLMGATNAPEPTAQANIVMTSTSTVLPTATVTSEPPTSTSTPRPTATATFTREPTATPELALGLTEGITVTRQMPTVTSSPTLLSATLTPTPRPVFPITLHAPTCNDYFQSGSEVRFEWRWAGQLGAGEYLEVRFQLGGEWVSRSGQITQSDIGDRWAAPIRLEGLGDSQYEWRVYHMAANRQTIHSRSANGCFFIETPSQPDPTTSPPDHSPTPPPPEI